MRLRVPTVARWSFGVISSVVLLTGLYVAFGKTRGPHIVVLTPNQRVTAPTGVGKVDVPYRITNRGGRNLIILHTQSSCECTVASVEPRVIKPGAEGIITLRATAPKGGERPVSVRVETNSEPHGELELRLTIVGIMAPPFVIDSSGTVQFGSIATGDAETVWVTTQELINESPWLTKVLSSLPFVRIEGGFVEEGPTVGSTIIRRYRYKATIIESPAEGRFRGEVVLAGSKHVQEVRLPIEGIVRAPVLVTPASVVASVGPGEDAPRLTVLFMASDPDFDLKVSPEEPLVERITLRELPNVARGVAFEVSPLEPFTDEIRARMAFRTNHPRAPSLQVPIMLQRIENKE